MISKTPVFLHEPKCGGTTVLYRFNELFLTRAANSENKNTYQFRLYEKVDPDNPSRPFITYTAFVDNENDSEKVRHIVEMLPNGVINKNVIFIEHRHFLKFQKHLKIKALMIAPNGLKFSNEGLFLDQVLNEYSVNPLFFSFIRNPLTKEQSFYYYLNSERSAFEMTHKALSKESFYDYVLNQMSDSWLIKTLHDINSDKEINLEIYKQTLDFMRKFRIAQTENSSTLFEDVLLECGFPMENIIKSSLRNRRFNENPNNQSEYVKPEDLSEEIKEIFYAKKYWELKLYKELSA